MPRKKKKAVDSSASKVLSSTVGVGSHHLGNVPPPQAWHKPGDTLGQAGAIPGELGEDAKMKELRYLQDMFDKKLDPVVVHMIMEDSDYKVDVALETLFKLAEDGQPREGEELSFKRVYPIESSSIDKQEAWGAALPGNDGAVSALPITTTSSGSTFEGFRSQRRSSEDGYPALPSQPLDTSQGIPPGLASKPTLNGYHTTSSNPGLPNQHNAASSSNWAPKPVTGMPKPASIFVDNSLFDFDLPSDVGGARPKTNSNTQKNIGENKSQPQGSKTSPDQYFRLPLPGEEEAAYNFYYQDAVTLSSHMDPSLFGYEENKDVTKFTDEEQKYSGNDPGSVNTSFGFDGRFDTKTEQPEVLSVQDIEASILDEVGEEDKSKRQEGIPQLKLFEGQQLVFPDIKGSVSGDLYLSDGSRSDHSSTSKNLDDTQQVKDGIEDLSGKQDDGFLAETEQDLGDRQPQAQLSSSLTAAVSHIITTEDDDLISEFMDSDEDLAHAVEEELDESTPEGKKPIGPEPVGPPRNLLWQRSLTENEEWEKLMKEIHASADDIHVEPIAESVQEFIKEHTPAAAVDKLFSPALDSSEESSKPLFPQYRLFPSWGGPDNFLDVASDDDAPPPRRKSKILEKLKSANNKQEDGGEEGKQMADNDSENASSQRSTPQLPVIKAELSVKAKEFVPQPAPEKPEESDDSESSNVETPVKPKPQPATVIGSGTPTPPPARSPFPMHGGHPPIPAFHPGYPNPPMAPGPFGMIDPNRMPHPFPPGVMPPPPPFQGRVIRPLMMPQRSRMPMGSRPGGPMPPGTPLRPMAHHPGVRFPPGNQPFMPGIPPRNLVPHMAGPPGSPLRMISHAHPSSGMQARFPSQGSPQHHHLTFRPSTGPVGASLPGLANSPSPPFSRPNVVPSPPTSQVGHTQAGAPLWPVVHSKIVQRGSDAAPGEQVKLLPSDKKVMCLMRGAPGSGKSTIARQLKGEHGVIYSTDEFFYKDGQYTFDPMRLGDAHEWNQKRAREACEAGTSPVIIDNTNSLRWEMKPYVSMALDNEYQVEFREPMTPWRNKPGQLAKKNSHNVPAESIAKQLERYEHNVTVENILKPSKRKGKKNPVDGTKQTEVKSIGVDKKTKTSRNRKDEVAENKDDQRSNNSTDNASESRVQEDVVTPSVAEMLQHLPYNDDDDEDAAIAAAEIPAVCEVEAETHVVSPAKKLGLSVPLDVVSPTKKLELSIPLDVVSPAKKLQLSIPLEIFKSTSGTEEKGFIGEKDEDGTKCKEQPEDAPKNGGFPKKDSTQDGNERDIIGEAGIELFKDDDHQHMHSDSDDDEAEQVLEDEGKRDEMLEPLEGVEVTSPVKSLKAADNTHDTNSSKITCVQVDIRSSVPCSVEYQKNDNFIVDTKSDQLGAEAEIMEANNETVNVISLDSMEDERLNDIEEQVGSIPNSAESSAVSILSSDSINQEKLTLSDSINQEKLTSLLKARQYAMEITKQQSAKYADAPCSQCSDKLDSYNAESSDQISVEQNAACISCLYESDPVTEDEMMECKKYTDGEELDGRQIILDNDSMKICNHKTMASKAAEGDRELRSDRILDDADKEDEDDPFEDALSDNSDNNTAETSSSVSFITPPQVSPESDRNECKVATDTDTLDTASSPTSFEEAKTKSSQRQSPRLAAVFSEALAMVEDEEEPQDEKVNWVFPGFTETKSNNEQEIALNNAPQVVDCSCQTEQEGFAILQKLKSGKLSEEDVIDMGYHVITGHTFLHYVIKDNAETASIDRDIPSIRKLDQSTMTEDIVRDRSLSTNLATLLSCFPNVPVESLQDVLTDCFGDVEWATNILIDSGYMETTPSKESDRYSVEETSNDQYQEHAVETDNSSLIDTNKDQPIIEVVKRNEQKLELSFNSEQTPETHSDTTPNIQVENISDDDVAVTLASQDMHTHPHDSECYLKESTAQVGSFVEHRLGIDEDKVENIKDIEDINLAAITMQKTRDHSQGTKLEVVLDSEKDQESNREKALGNLISDLIHDGLVAAVQSGNTNPSVEYSGSTKPNLAAGSSEQHEIKDISPCESLGKSSITGDGVALEKLNQEVSGENLDTTKCDSEHKLVCDDNSMQAPATSKASTRTEKPHGAEKDIQREVIVGTDTKKENLDTEEESINRNNAEIVDSQLQISSEVTKEKSVNADTDSDPKELIESHSETCTPQLHQHTLPMSTTLHHHSTTSQSKVSENVVTVPLELLVPLSTVNPEGAKELVKTKMEDSNSTFIGSHGNKECTSQSEDESSKEKSSSPAGKLEHSTVGGISSNFAVLQNEVDCSRQTHPSSEVVVLGEATGKDDAWKVVVSTPTLTTSEDCISKPVTDSNESVSNSDRLYESSGKPGSEASKSPSSSLESSPTRLGVPKQIYAENETSSLESSPKRSSEMYSDTDSDSCSNPLDAWGLDGGMMLQLDAAFALQLQEMFGPVGFHLTPGGMSDQDLEVKISHDIAKQLHTLWASTIQERFDAEQKQMERMIKTDEQLARELQQEEELIHLQEQEEKRKQNQLSENAIRSGARPKTKLRKPKPLLLNIHHTLAANRVVLEGQPGMDKKSWWQQSEKDYGRHLQEIMDEETARRLVDEDEASVSSNEDTVQTLAVKIKRKQLYQQFPTVDTSLLDDIYAKHEYELIPTVRDVERLLGDQAPPRDVYTDEELMRLEQRQMELAEKESLAQSQQTEDDEDSSSEWEGTNYQSYDNPCYHDYRAEATMHYQQRQECFQKAAAAYQRGLKDLASFYSRQGHQHTELLRAAHRRASEAIMEARQAVLDENVLDLHGLHVEEAVEKLADVLKDRGQPTNTSSDIPPLTQRPSHLLIITGRGKNSRGGVARIKPAVATYLKNNNYRFTIPNAGLIKVLW
ncbi:uncharacterized protein [Amphiura filiformis]|uniref:uncharacterized protein n=1 Tax=Amphiura filiformis TaxID=82378 RepID=UPI003B212147